MRVSSSSALLVLAFVPSVAFALTFAPADTYTDVRVTSPEAAGINLLTREGVVQGYGNGFFGTTRTINRAEFLKIAMKVVAEDMVFVSDSCFPDVRSSDWFSPFVCEAKARGIVRGKSVVGYFSGQPFFDPATTITYGEALKILTQLFAYDIQFESGTHWAEDYYRAAAARGTDLPMRITLDTSLTRGRAARLVATFLAESKGQLEEFRRAEQGDFRSSTSSSSSSSVSSSASSSSSSTSSLPSGSTDPHADMSIRSRHLLLGETGPIVASANIFIELEPLDVLSIGINLTSATPTVQGFLVYDSSRRFLGKATLDPTVSTNRRYTLRVPSGTVTVEKRASLGVYVRPVLLSKDLGGQSAQVVEVSNIIVEGFGIWSSQKYTQASSETFQAYETARATITSITNAIETNAPLVAGTNLRIGAFRFEGRRTDASARIVLNDLIFTIGATGGTSVSNVMLGADGTSDRFACTVSSTVSCLAIPETFGTLTDGPRILTLYANVTVESPTGASLQLTLNEPGDILQSGALSWTDGTATYQWLGLETPLARGTYYRY